VRLGELLYEWNDLPGAWDHLSRGLERAELGGDARSLIAGYIIAARLKLTQGSIEEATGYLERARPLVEATAAPDWHSHFERVQLHLWLAQNRLRAAVNWADDRLSDDSFLRRPENEGARLALIHVLIVKGDLPARERALALLHALLGDAREAGMGGVQITALALQAMAQWKGGDRPGALTALERALRLAEPEGYVRLFADLGLPMVRLLTEARSRQVMTEYVKTLLAACDALPDDHASGRGALAEPLTSREMEIVALLAAGLTNQEIAEQLMIARETVKKHSGNIYSKLGVRRRTEAAARARELDLLG
jgi:LuxR family transcriptional regulator, maltose regulon positive regulatory protein